MLSPFMLISTSALLIVSTCLTQAQPPPQQPQSQRQQQFSPLASPQVAAQAQPQQQQLPQQQPADVDDQSSSTSSTSSTLTVGPTAGNLNSSDSDSNGGSSGSSTFGDSPSNSAGTAGSDNNGPPQQGPRQLQPPNGQQNGLATLNNSSSSSSTISTFIPANMPQIANIRAQCRQDGMTVLVEFNNNPFNGVIYSKGAFYTPGCVYIQPNSQSTSYTFEVPMNACGTVANTDTQTNRKYFSNTIVFQMDPLYQEVWDQARTIRCEWTTRFEETITFTPYNVDMLQTEEIPFSGDTLTTSFAIQQGRGPFAPLLTDQLVRIGDTLTLVVFVNGDTGFDIAVLDCYASDSRQRSVLQLTDQGGCPLRPKILMPWQKTFETKNTGASVIAYAYVNAFKFPDDMVVNLRCNIAVCKNGCPETCTQQQGGGGPQQFTFGNTGPGGATGGPVASSSTTGGGGNAGTSAGGSAGLGASSSSGGGTNVVRVPPNGGSRLNDAGSNQFPPPGISGNTAGSGDNGNGGGFNGSVGGGYGPSNDGGGRNNFFNNNRNNTSLPVGINLGTGNFHNRQRGGGRSARSGDSPNRFVRRRREASDSPSTTTMQSIPKMSEEMMMKRKVVAVSALTGGQRRVRAFEQRIIVASPDQFQLAPRILRSLPTENAEFINNVLSIRNSTPFAALQQQDLLQQQQFQQATFGGSLTANTRRRNEQQNIIDAEPALFDVTKKLICVDTLIGSMVTVAALGLLSVATGLAAAFYLRLPLSKRG